MTELQQIVYTSILTIIGGVLIFVIGQIILKFYIDPIQKLDECRGNICDALLFYRNIYLNPNSTNKRKMRETSKKIRELATELLAKQNMVRGRHFFEELNFIITKKNIHYAHKALIGLSNSIEEVSPEDVQEAIKINRNREKEIKKGLKIYFE